MDDEAGDVYEQVIQIDASPATVYELLTDADAFATWMGIGVELDARPGGAVRIDLGVVTVMGTVEELLPDRRVVLTWGWDDERIALPPGSSRVSFDISPDGDGTSLHLRHSGLAGPLLPFHAFGWELFLPRLVRVASGADPGAYPLTPQDAARAMALLQGG